jgi:HSP20 family molecular chaperone IbpA
MDPFKNKSLFGNMGQMNQHPFSTEHLNQIKEMVEQYNSVLNEEFWSSINGMGNQKGSKKWSTFPIDMWESDDELFVLAYIPGIKETNQVKTSFMTERKIRIKGQVAFSQPPSTTRQLASELPNNILQRDLTLPYPVESDNYSVHLEEGVTTLILKKSDTTEINVPFDF